MQTKESFEQEPLWTEEKEMKFKKAIEDFTVSNLRIPTVEEEDELWHVIFHTIDNKEKKNGSTNNGSTNK